MPRIRTIKPEFWSDEKFAPLRAIDRLVFLGLVSLADDAGRLVDNVKQIDGFLFLETEESSRESLDTLARLGRITRYISASGQKLIQITNWTRHQKVDKPAKYVLPAPTMQDMVQHVIAASSREGSENGATSSRDPRAPTYDLRPTTYDRGPTTNDQRAEADLSRENGAPDTAAESRINGKPPARTSPLTELPNVVAFMRKFYPRSRATTERRRDVSAQLEAALTVRGVKFGRAGYIHAFTPERLDAKCAEVIADGVANPDKAIVVLLKKLGDTSDGSAPGHLAEQRAIVDRGTEDRATSEDLVHAAIWLADNPEIVGTLENNLATALEEYRMPLGPDEELDSVSLAARRIVRNNLLLILWRSAGCPVPERVARAS